MPVTGQLGPPSPLARGHRSINLNLNPSLSLQTAFYDSETEREGSSSQVGLEQCPRQSS